MTPRLRLPLAPVSRIILAIPTMRIRRALSVILLIASVTYGWCWSQIFHRTRRKVVSHAIGITLALLTTQANAAHWELMNGEVDLDNPLVITLDKKLTLSNPTLIGSGGGGAVFAFDDETNDAPLVKVSWKGSTKSVERECKTLQILEAKGVTGAELCLGDVPYPTDPSRVMIVVKPYVRDAVASVQEVNEDKQAFAVEQIMRTLVQMLAADVVTIDVQPLISKASGKVLFIDMTEAEVLRPPYSFLDKTLMSSFTTEMMALVPDTMKDFASSVLKQEISTLKGRGAPYSMEAISILEGSVDI